MNRFLMMDRRELLKQMLTLTCGTLWLPSISFSCSGTADVPGLDISEEEKKLVYRVSEAIIPSDKKIKGADGLLIGDFVLLMVHDCRKQDEQQRFAKGLKNLNTAALSIHKKALADFETEDWEHFLTAVIKSGGQAPKDKKDGEEPMEDSRYFVNTVKNLTIQGFTSSKYFMTEIMPYEMFPGGFKGKVKIQPGEKVNIYG